MNGSSIGRLAICAVIGTVLCMSVGYADETRYEFGVRANVLLGDGKPANDILGAGLRGRRYLDDGWFLGATLDAYQYDFERPASLVGIRQSPDVDVIDADGSTTSVGVFFGREYGDANEGFRWFWSLGVGAGFESVDDVSGPRDDGGSFDLDFETETSFQLRTELGTSYHFNARWSASFAARLEHHIMDIRITDRVTGATTRIDSQSPVGAYVSLNYRF